MTPEQNKAMIEALEQQCKEKICESLMEFCNLAGISIKDLDIRLNSAPNRYGIVKSVDIIYNTESTRA